MLGRTIRREIDEAAGERGESVYERWAPPPPSRRDALDRVGPYFDEQRDRDRRERNVVPSEVSAASDVVSGPPLLSSRETRAALREVVELAKSARRGSVWFRDQVERPQRGGAYREAASAPTVPPRLEINLRRPADGLAQVGLFLSLFAVAWIPWALSVPLTMTATLAPLAAGFALLVLATRSWGWCRIVLDDANVAIRVGGRTERCELIDLRVAGTDPVHLVSSRSHAWIALAHDDAAVPHLRELLGVYGTHLDALAAETRR